MGCPYPASTLWAKESLWNAVILSDLTKFMYFWFSGFLLLFTESSIALERALLQSVAPVSNLCFVSWMFPDSMYRSVFESEWKWLCSKVMLPDVFESEPVTYGWTNMKRTKMRPVALRYCK